MPWRSCRLTQLSRSCHSPPAAGRPGGKCRGRRSAARSTSLSAADRPTLDLSCSDTGPAGAGPGQGRAANVPLQHAPVVTARQLETVGAQGRGGREPLTSRQPFPRPCCCCRLCLAGTLAGGSGSSGGSGRVQASCQAHRRDACCLLLGYPEGSRQIGRLSAESCAFIVLCVCISDGGLGWGLEYAFEGNGDIPRLWSCN